MNILILSPYQPDPISPHAGGLTLFNYLKGLSPFFNLHILYFKRTSDRDAMAEISPYCKSIRAINFIDLQLFKKKFPISYLFHLAISFSLSLFYRRPFLVQKYRTLNMKKALQEILSQKKIDLVLLEYPMMAPYIQELKDKKVILDLHEVGTVPAERKFKLQENFLFKLADFFVLYLWKNYEKNWYKKFPLILTVSEEDKARLLELNPHLNILVNPHGVDTDVFRPMNVEKIPNSIVFIGNYQHKSNIDAAIYFLERIYPLIKNKKPNLRLYLIGRDPPEKLKFYHNPPSIEVPGFIDDLPSFLNRMEISIIPLRVGGGIKIKVLQSMAMELPVVSTSIGVEGIEIQNGVHLFVEDDPHLFAEKVVLLMENPSLREKLGKSARDRVERHYSAKKMIENLIDIIKNITEN